ncbi:MAG: translation elongation factor-like protein [Deltaproteobacteria bacterium]|nr:translation elongation factor-like protein [Deltaproteobacteria bacterium]
MREEIVGTVTHYYSHLGVGTVTLDNELKVGDKIHIKGHLSDFTQKVDSIQIEHKSVEKAKKGDNVGIRLSEHGREHDKVYKIIEE